MSAQRTVQMDTVQIDIRSFLWGHAILTIITDNFSFAHSSFPTACLISIHITMWLVESLDDQNRMIIAMPFVWLLIKVIWTLFFSKSVTLSWRNNVITSKAFFSSNQWHCSEVTWSVCYSARGIDDHHINPNINDRDHLVGQLNRGICVTFETWKAFLSPDPWLCPEAMMWPGLLFSETFETSKALFLNDVTRLQVETCVCLCTQLCSRL